MSSACRKKWLALAVIGLPLHGQAEGEAFSPLTQITGSAPAGFYLAGEVSRVDGGGVPEIIRGSNPGSVTVTEGGDDRSGWKAALGYQWADGLAFQLAALELGDAPVALESGGATMAELDQAADTLHPQTAHGAEIAVSQAWYFRPEWRLSAGAGLWYWRSEWDVPVNGVARTYSDSGIGPTATLDTGWRFRNNLEARLGLHHLRMDDGYINTLGAGLVYQWGQ